MSTLQHCDEFRDLVDDLVGHDLSPEETARLTAHARVCSRCALDWRSALGRAAAVASLTPWSLEASGVRPPAPGSTADAVFARLAAGEGAPTRFQRWRAPLALAAAILVMGGGSIFAYRALSPKESKASLERPLAADAPKSNAGSTGHESSQATDNNSAPDGTVPLGAAQRRLLLDSAMNDEMWLRGSGAASRPGAAPGILAPNTHNVQLPGGGGSRPF